MNHIMAQKNLKLTQKLIIPIIIIFCINARPSRNIKKITTPSGDIIRITLAITAQAQKKGLSGIKKSDFQKNEGLLFFNKNDDYRSFWMPNTLFNMDIFFLNKNFKVTHITRNLHAHPGYNSIPSIAKTKKIFCRHVLEMRSDSPIAEKIKKGMILKIK